MSEAKAVYKYPIEPDRTMQLPEGARILSVQVQHGSPVLWALVDPAAKLETRGIRVCGTGHPLPASAGVWGFLGTFQMHDGALVFHVFEVPK